MPNKQNVDSHQSHKTLDKIGCILGHKEKSQVFKSKSCRLESQTAVTQTAWNLRVKDSLQGAVAMPVSDLEAEAGWQLSEILSQ